MSDIRSNLLTDFLAMSIFDVLSKEFNLIGRSAVMNFTVNTDQGEGRSRVRVDILT